MARGGFEPRRELVSVLALRRDPRPPAVDSRRFHPPVRQLLLRLRDGVRTRRKQRLPRTDHDWLLLQRQRPLRPTPGPGARVRDVRRARSDDAAVRAAAAALGEVDAMRRRWIAPGAIVWLLVAAAGLLELLRPALGLLDRIPS